MNSMLRPGTIKLMRIFGIRIGVSASWFFVLFFFIYWLSEDFRGVLGSSTTAFVVAVASALAFFASLVLHELGHAIVARRSGIGILGIDLFFFGGLARLSRESQSAGEEFRVAVAGPLVTLVIIIVSLAAYLAVAGGGNFLDTALLRAGAHPTPALVLLGWLALINTGVLAFNLVPAFPLDGGRIARAIAWKLTGDRHRATRASGHVGQGFAYLLGAGGLYLLLAGDLSSGLWLLVISLFLGQAARGAVRASSFSERLAGITVADIMDTEPVTIPDPTSLLQAQEEFFLRYRWPWFAVTDSGGRFLGVVRRERVEQEVSEGRPALTVGEVLDEAGSAWGISTDQPLEALIGSEGLRRLGAAVAVDGDGILRGVVTLAEVRRALTPVAGA